MLRPDPPRRDPAFRPSPSGSGLLVPAAISRDREVWTKDESRLLDRAIALLGSRGLKLQLACNDPACASPTLERMRTTDGSFTLRCGHKDRVFTRAF